MELGYESFTLKNLRDRRDLIKIWFGNNGHSHYQGLQKVHTPYDLSQDIILKLIQNLEEDNKLLQELKILTINLEVVDVLVNSFGVPAKNIVFISDLNEKTIVSNIYGIQVIERDFLQWETDMKFDCIIMNPPYQNNHKGHGGARNNIIWPDFVKKSISLCKDNGFCCHIHPPLWRKPDSDILELLRNYDIRYLEMHGEKDGLKTFNCSTQYDVYIMKKSKALPNNGNIIKDQNNNVMNNLDYRYALFIPNWGVHLLGRITTPSGENSIDIVYTTICHAQNTKRVSLNRNSEYIFPCVHTITNEGPNFYYTTSENMEFFNFPKIIISTGRNLYYLLDLKGEYGTTAESFSIKIGPGLDYEKIIKSFSTLKFKNLIESTKWSNFRIDYRMFKYFRKDFWKEFVNEDGSEKE